MLTAPTVSAWTVSSRQQEFLREHSGARVEAIQLDATGDRTACVILTVPPRLMVSRSEEPVADQIANVAAEHVVNGQVDIHRIANCHSRRSTDLKGNEHGSIERAWITLIQVRCIRQ